MRISLLGSWTCAAAPRPFRTWLRTAPGSFGVHLADGRFVVRRAEAELPEVAALSVPAGAIVGLDPRGESIAWVAGARLSLLGIKDATLKAVDLSPELQVRDVEFNATGERLWVFGIVGDEFHACAFDRTLSAQGAHRLTLAQGPYPTSIHLSPREDAFVLTTNEDGRDPEATIHRLGVRIEAGVARVLFDRDEIDHPCAGFTADGNAVVGADAYNGIMLFGWPSFELIAEAPPPDGCESRFDAIVVGTHVLAESHPADTSDSSLWVLAFPSLKDQELIDWSARGEFGSDDDDAGADLGPSLGEDRFLEVAKGPDDTWTLRAWRLEA